MKFVIHCELQFSEAHSDDDFRMNVESTVRQACPGVYILKSRPFRDRYDTLMKTVLSVRMLKKKR